MEANGKSTDDDFEAISQQNFNKVARAVEKIGYKEGAFDGRESVFQQGFDTGFENGFQSGFVLGNYIGHLNSAADISNKSAKDSSVIVSAASTDLILKRPTRGQCVICTDQNLINEDIDMVMDLQKKHIEKINIALKQKYPEI